MSAGVPSLAARIVRWQAEHGRHHLPWQDTRDPYRVWLSEIMLQQTQVSTVLAYYPRFLERFPGIEALASGSQDEVLALWSGLGYYSRARLLHRCAQTVMTEYGGVFPERAAQLQTLPGIGRSTAAAIAAFCHGERVAILDGNVKRVLSRALGFGGDLALPAQEAQLWAQAQEQLPRRHAMAAYTQGLMDLGATVCTRRQAQCQSCPLAAQCVALAQDRVHEYPVKTRRVQRRAETWWLLLLERADGSVFLQRRAQKGIWAGLFCLPVYDGEAALCAAVPATALARLQWLPVVPHELTHRSLRLSVGRVRLEARAQLPLDGAWVAPADWPSLGLPAPVKRILGDAGY